MHIGKERFTLRLGYMQNALRLPLNTMSLSLFRATIHLLRFLLLQICFQRGKEWKGKPSLIRHLEVRGATDVVLSGRAFQKVGRDPFRTAEKKPPLAGSAGGIGLALLRSHA